MYGRAGAKDIYYPLEVRNLSKQFGGLTAVRGVSLTVPAGEVRAIIGPNGAGKTTLFNLICGDLLPSAGKVYLFGEDVTRLSLYERTRRGVGRTFQITSLFPGLRVMENVLLAVGKKNLGVEMFRPVMRRSLSRATELLDQFGFGEKQAYAVSELSYGEQRQMEIILALALEPKLILLDEPTSGLSPAELSGVLGIIDSLRGKVTVVIIEHDMDVVFSVADYITVLHYGAVLSEGTRDEVAADDRVRQVYLGEKREG